MYNKKFYDNHKEAVQKSQLAWYHAHRDEVNERRRAACWKKSPKNKKAVTEPEITMDHGDTPVVQPEFTSVL